MPNKLANHRKTVHFNMLLDGARNIGNSVANLGLLNALVQRSLCYLNQQCDFRGNSSNRNGDCCISVKTFITNTKIKRNDIALPQYFFL